MEDADWSIRGGLWHKSWESVDFDRGLGLKPTKTKYKNTQNEPKQLDSSLNIQNSSHTWG